MMCILGRVMGKPIGNVAPVRRIPGRSKDGYQCRHCSTETETLAHVLARGPVELQNVGVANLGPEL